MPGENYPPMHPRCRCTVVPSLGEVIGKRTSKVGGKRVKVPADMTYTEWRKVYIDKTETFEQWLKEKETRFDIQRFNGQRIPEGDYNLLIRRQV